MHAYKAGNNVRKGLLNIDVVGSLMAEHAVVARGDVSSNLILPPKSERGAIGRHGCLKNSFLRVRVPPLRPIRQFSKTFKTFNFFFLPKGGCGFESRRGTRVPCSSMVEYKYNCLDNAEVALTVERRPDLIFSR